MIGGPGYHRSVFNESDEKGTKGGKSPYIYMWNPSFARSAGMPIRDTLATGALNSTAASAWAFRDGWPKGR